MTRTEDRLADALQASAARVRDDRLRPLTDEPLTGQSLTGRVPTGQPGALSRARRGWLTPVAAAAGVVLAVVLSLVVASGMRPGADSPRTTAGADRAGSLPRYFAQLTGSMPTVKVVVRSTSTGAVVASTAFPAVKGWLVNLDALAAAPDGRTFYLDFDAARHSGSGWVEHIWIYRLSVPGSRLTRVRGGVLPGSAGIGSAASLAVSPDGSQLALTALADPGQNTSRGFADAITVVNLRTGARHTWRDGLYRPGKLLTIPDLSWTADGRSLIFLGLWCAPPQGANHCTDSSGREYHDVQVRSLSLTAGGGTLGRSTLLVSQSARYPLIVDAAAGPGPSQLTLLVLSGQPRAGIWPVISIDRVSAATGALLGVTYRKSTDGTGMGAPTGSHISADPGGRNLLFSYYGGNGFYTGWVSQGKLSLLPVSQPYFPTPITAW